MKHTYHLPAIDAIQATNRGAMDHIAVYDMAGFCEDAETLGRRSSAGGWYGEHGTSKAIELARTGDVSKVPASDAFLTRFESLAIVSKKYRVIDDVVGAFPNIPAYLAGVPTQMRRRHKQQVDTAPLSIFADLTTSGGISAEHVQKRGIAILALVRLLSNVRPVEVYAMTGLGSYTTAEYCAVRLDTSPLDLARAAHMLTSTAVARDLCYRLCNKVGKSSNGMWPYGYDVEKQRKHGAEILLRVVTPGSEVLFLPPMYMTDESINNPEKWLKDMLHKYGGNTVEQEDE